MAPTNPRGPKAASGSVSATLDLPSDVREEEEELGTFYPKRKVFV